MSKGGEDEALRELVIVRRRRGGDHDGHHGGVWKIAYADFMTAMMAFFLVMWLVNMTDDKKIVQIAAYFNPLRLNEKSPSTRGFEDSTQPSAVQTAPGEPAVKGSAQGGSAQQEKDAAKSKAEKAKDSKAKTKSAHAEAELFIDPMKTIQSAAERAPAQDPAAGGGAKAWGHPSAMFGKALLDPYDPVHRGSSPVPPNMRSPEPQQGHDPVPGRLRFERASGPTFRDTPRTKGTPPATQAPPVAAKTPEGSSPPPVAAAANTPAATINAAAAPAQPAAGAAAGSSAAEKMAPAIEREIRASMLDFKGPRPQVDVRATPEGVLISVADDIEFGMFAIASAEPLPVAVAFMQRISEILKERPGSIVVRGHTDGRPYRSAAYDNWRLSTARAHMAQYMLVRGGVPADRITRVEGHADRHLLNPKDKEAAQNRRIEILILVGGP